VDETVWVFYKFRCLNSYPSESGRMVIAIFGGSSGHCRFFEDGHPSQIPSMQERNSPFYATVRIICDL
jgi:hypothetical protein